MYIQVFLPSIFIAYFHVTIGYNWLQPPHWPDSYPVCSLTHCLLNGNMNCYRLLEHFKSVDKAEGRTTSTNSCNSKPSAPSICKFQAVHRCEGSATSRLFICGLLNGALDSLECVKLIGLIGKGKLQPYTS
jgi:hypothetical protein